MATNKFTSDEFEFFQRQLNSSDTNDDNAENVLMNGIQNHSPNRNENASSQNEGDLARMVDIMVQENRRRDEMMERMFQRLMQPTAASPSSTQSSNYHIMPDLSRSISSFDGEGGSSKAREWFDTIRSMQQLHNWPDSFALETARANLQGGAAHWFKAKADQLVSWDQFTEAFKKTFMCTESLPAKWQRMTERVQQKGESISSYFHEKAKLCHVLALSFNDTKEQLLVGLWSKELCSAVAAMPHRDTDDLLHDLLSQEKLHQQRYDRIKGNKAFTQPERKLGERQKVVQRKEVTPLSKDNSVRNHEMKRLPARNTEGQPLCFVCKKYGHVSKYCTLRQPERPREALLTSSTDSFQTKDDNLKYFKNAQIDGQNIKAYIDQGSTTDFKSMRNWRRRY